MKRVANFVIFPSKSMPSIIFAFVALLTFTRYLQRTDASLILHNHHTNTTIDVEALSALRWMESVTNDDLNNLVFPDMDVSSSLPVIPIDTKFKNYIPCDLSSTTAKLYEPLFQEYQLQLNANLKSTGESVDLDDGWIALIDNKRAIECNGIHPYHLYYVPYATYIAQQLGASALIYSLDFNTRSILTPELMKTYSNPEYNEILNTLNNLELSIPAFAVKSPTLDFSVFAPHSDEEQFTEDDDAFLVLKAPLAADLNSIDEFIHPWGVNSILKYALGLIGVAISFFVMYKLPTVVKFFIGDNKSSKLIHVSAISSTLEEGVRSNNVVVESSEKGKTDLKTPTLSKAAEAKKSEKDRAKKVALLMRLFILVPEIVIGFLRLYAALRFVPGIDFISNQLLTSLAATMGCFTDIVTTMYCRDVYQIFKASSSMKPAPKPFLLKYKFGGGAVCAVAFLMIGFDQFNLSNNLYKTQLSNGTSLPLLYILISNFTVTVVLFRMSALMKKEVKAVEVKFLEKSEMKSTRNKSTDDMVLKRTQYFLRVRRFIFLAALSRSGTILSFALIILRVHRTSVFAETFVRTLLYPCSSIAASVFQILSCLEFPPSTATTSRSDGTEIKKANMKMMHVKELPALTEKEI